MPNVTPTLRRRIRREELSTRVASTSQTDPVNLDKASDRMALRVIDPRMRITITVRH